MNGKKDWDKEERRQEKKSKEMEKRKENSN